VNCGNGGASRPVVTSKADLSGVKGNDEFVRGTGASQGTALACGNPKRDQHHKRRESITRIHTITALPAGRFAIQDRVGPRQPIDCLLVLTSPHVAICFAPSVHCSCHTELRSRVPRAMPACAMQGGKCRKACYAAMMIL
jgi:hypothetical protein